MLCSRQVTRLESIERSPPWSIPRRNCCPLATPLCPSCVLNVGDTPSSLGRHVAVCSFRRRSVGRPLELDSHRAPLGRCVFEVGAEGENEPVRPEGVAVVDLGESTGSPVSISPSCSQRRG
jgi:hypothetical protein